MSHSFAIEAGCTIDVSILIVLFLFPEKKPNKNSTIKIIIINCIFIYNN